MELPGITFVESLGEIPPKFLEAIQRRTPRKIPKDTPEEIAESNSREIPGETP